MNLFYGPGGTGEVWAVHTAWSGNHQHYAERVFTGEQLLGGGELLLPGLYPDPAGRLKLRGLDPEANHPG
ncbi:hypothetical protein ASG77_03495 [Arthrobacter sp. Soil762]|nr:glycoside hydrolase family 36 N-terminal domain-containing protein [Arthrobacter sp. Soil762]KRE81000.1 hypothetical protein ASG77_03495 [Arthrobacter sp. Soil762]